ncbi:hypothetical protein FBUS_03745 [Fasciolopsis buskii]|uniref:Uncharacterized protein n=1 Tax=Fasciolopsis buskii TaxID=27845 RepID=A0A8E0VEA5_9TREM|nr:hypothetical protein FBUS_03745 [Fasciolopsis buski]
MPFQGADSCLPLAPALTTTLSGFRPTEAQIETSVSSAHMNTTHGVPQLWASSTPVSSFSSIPIHPGSIPQPVTFPITANSSSTALAPVVAAVSTSSSSPTTTSTSTILPHPPALQPCPALTKRFHRLCPLPPGRSPNSSGTVLSPSPTKRNPSVPLRPSGLSTTLAMSTGCATEKRTISSSGYSVS